MSLQGFTQSGTSGFGITNYDSTGPSCTSDNAKLNGTSVCDDVILIPVNSGTEVQFVRISAYNNFLTLCEVQVFAGNANIPLTFTVCFTFTFTSYICICFLILPVAILLQLYENMWRSLNISLNNVGKPKPLTINHSYKLLARTFHLKTFCYAFCKRHHHILNGKFFSTVS